MRETAIYKSLLRIACVYLGLLQHSFVIANPNAKRLYEDVLVKRDYNKLVRPVSNHTNTLTVLVGLKLAQLIDIDEKNQIMTTNVWVTMIWNESRLSWNSKEYGDITQLRIPSSDIWIPSVVLFNNADGNYEPNKDTKALLLSSGMVVWEPPAIFKSSCQIDVEFFPFDKQRCAMKFASWTYDGLQVDLRHVSQTNHTSPDVEYGIDLDGLHESTEWDLLQVPARRNQKVYPCCPEPYPDITFTIVLRRKTLFYTVNLIFPCVAISFLSLFVFYLPSDSGEKTTLCISILLAVTFFFLVLAESIPPTSLVVPLIGKYLLFTMVLVTFSIVITVVEMNFNVRRPATHKMSPWTRKIFLEWLPKLLLVKRPKVSRYSVLHTDTDGRLEAEPAVATGTANHGRGVGGGDIVSESASWRPLQTPPGRREWSHWSRDQLAPSQAEDAAERVDRRDDALRRRMTRDLGFLLQPDDAHRRSSPQEPTRSGVDETWQLRPEFLAATVAGNGYRQRTDPGRDPRVRRDIHEAVKGVHVIAQSMRDKLEEQMEIDDWNFVTFVMDRLFLLLFSVGCIIATFGMFLQAPSLYDHQQPINVSNMNYKGLHTIV